MKKEAWAGVIFLGILLIIISFYFDSIISKGVYSIHNEMIDSFFLFINVISSEIILFAVFSALLLWRENKRRWILPLWACFGISAFVSFILKITIQRLRPYQAEIVSILPSLIEESHSIWNFSFPSSHSMLAFCVIPLLAEQFPKLKKVFFALAILIAFSRIYLGVHFLSDVLAGALIGYIIGTIIVNTEKDNCWGKNIYNKVFNK